MAGSLQGGVAGVGRYVKVRAKPGEGDALARKLLQVAEDLRDAPGCELYVINRSPGEPDVVWVTELWRSQELLDASLEREETRATMPEVQALLAEDGFERIDVEPLGGVGHEPAEPGFAIVNLDEVKDLAPEFGLGDTGESRFAGGDSKPSASGSASSACAPGCVKRSDTATTATRRSTSCSRALGASPSTIRSARSDGSMRFAWQPARPGRSRQATRGSSCWRSGPITPATPS